MKNPPQNILHRLLYVLHKGFSDVRYIAKAGKSEQAYELADTMENIPGFIADWQDDHLEKIVQQLHRYQDKYREVSWYDYAKYLETEEPPERF